MSSGPPRQKRETQFSGGTRIGREGDLDESLLNMVHFYRDSLRALLSGETSLESIPLGNRRRFTASGIIRRFGSKYELTEIGSELLHYART
jgi:hypothetical protein